MQASFARGILAVTFAVWSVTGCSDEMTFDAPAINADSIASLELTEQDSDGGYVVLPLRTPDGSGQTVHPDYALMPNWLPRRYLVATPYTYTDSLQENPSLFAQSVGLSWEPHGLGNPVVRRTTGYLSDPDMVADPDLNELRIYYREVTSRNRIWLIRSSDGIGWSSPVKVVSARNHRVISPSVVRRDAGHWMMWSVNAGRDGCSSAATHVELRRSIDGIRWSPPQGISLSQPPFFVWHIDVQWIPSRQEYWALYNVKTSGSCNTQLLFLATSTDGTSWTTYPSPVLRLGDIPVFSDIVYRSTFAYNPRTDNIRFWFSGARWEANGYVWRTVYQKRKRSDVFAAIGTPPQQQLSFRRGREAPLLIDPP